MINVAVLGYGTVGSGVYEVINTNNDIVSKKAGDKVNIELLLSPGSEPHHFEPTPSQIVSIENCDLFIYTGGENDKWAQSIVDSLDSDIKVLKLIDCVETYKEEEIDTSLTYITSRE